VAYPVPAFRHYTLGVQRSLNHHSPLQTFLAFLAFALLVILAGSLPREDESVAPFSTNPTAVLHDR
jgi:hypothetical protein